MDPNEQSEKKYRVGIFHYIGRWRNGRLLQTRKGKPTVNHVKCVRGGEGGEEGRRKAQEKKDLRSQGLSDQRVQRRRVMPIGSYTYPEVRLADSGAESGQKQSSSPSFPVSFGAMGSDRDHNAS